MNLIKTNSASDTGILWLPGDSFFTYLTEVPEGTPAAQLYSLAELSIEALSPFPSDQIYWGFLHQEGQKTLTLYAAYKGSLNENFVSKLDEASYALPEFLQGYDLPSSTPSIHFLKTDNSLCALAFEPGKPVPLHIDCAPISEGDLERTRKAILDGLNLPEFTIQPGHWECSATRVESKGSIRLERTYFNANNEAAQSHTTKVPFRQNFIWNADVRNSMDIQEKRKALRIEKFIWNSLIAASITIIAFIGLEALNLGGKGYLKTRTNKIENQAALVSEIESKTNLVFKIEEISGPYTNPFAKLNAINELRPEKVYFTSLNLKEKNTMSIEGAASDANQVNAYVKKLNESEKIISADLAQIVSRQGKVFFTLNLEFKPVDSA